MNSVKSRLAMTGGSLLLWLIALIQPAQAQFVHPGGLHTQADFDRMAAKVAAGEQPWTGTYNRLIADPHAQLSWTPRPVAVLCRTGNPTICSNNYTRSQEDAQAIYDLVIRYRISGDTRYADKAITIMDYVVSALSPGESADSAEAVAYAFTWLAAHLTFDESSGDTAFDATGYGWNGALINGPTWVPGYMGNAVSLSGASQYVSLPTGVIGNLNDFTLAMWVNLNSVSTWSRIFDFGVDRERYMFLTPQRAGTPARMSFAITTGSSRAEERIDGPAPLSVGWHHVAVTLAGADGTGLGILYVDGEEVGRNSTMFHTPGMLGALGNTVNNWIGRSQYDDPYLNGSVDDFRIYSGALTAAEIAALAAGTMKNHLPALPDQLPDGAPQGVVVGKPVIRGTRLAVEFIVDLTEKHDSSHDNTDDDDAGWDGRDSAAAE